MHIQEITIWARNLDEQRAFYTSVLNLPLIEEAEHKVLLQAGSTRLILQEGSDTWNGTYHMAFNVPAGRFAEIKDWLSGRAVLLTGMGGKNQFDSEGWNSVGIYFKDAGGNILEFIARRNLPDPEQPADLPGIECISEIGVASEHVQETSRQLIGWTKEGFFDGEDDNNFAAVGDDHGLLIVVEHMRMWFPQTQVAADFVPLHLVLENQKGKTFEFSAPPYPIQIIEEAAGKSRRARGFCGPYIP